MLGYGLDSDFWLGLLIMLTIVSVLLVSFNTIIRKWLKVERKRILSYNHVNEKHKRIDWIIRIIAVISLILGYSINIMSYPANTYWFLQPWYIIIVFLVVAELGRAVMERKYAQNSNAYKVTILEMTFILLIYISILTTDFWGLV
ncbi:DUF4181 domain-containing protein [Halobacillus litoralis]|uniref:DUF4181 domain-containing protein n=1 Tax=Halobacillus litoralis TaxID=45668 RepID=A0A845FCB8_9BACI|nr:DUF4181 domain-containing protein [Halobacillus litoralis]MYL71580.1 DUF4181 domain-containing protein [Halobacillus litoralis]